MIKVIENDILPELEARVPTQAERTAAYTKPFSASFISRFALFAITDLMKQGKAMPFPV